MFKRTKIALCSVALAMASVVASPADAAGSFWQCAPFARMFSGIQLFGAAASWWNQAVGKYSRGETPKEGAVLVFKSIGSMRSGHVATVSQVVSDRVIKVTHANWSTPGKVENDVEVMDVSAKNDWSKVRVWFKSLGGLGTSSYPVYGFIYNGKAAKGASVTADAGSSADAIVKAAADAKAARAKSPLAALVG
ncbi:CHAP domain-containing protein [Sphingomonas oryzagri]|jgi:surface antigen|uniref:CHAP domain-containing protein n=1 Tax=Sphingomonas oryzagri TaxID=3042314 RepID=A0ABT6N4P9_9SPHN|nr:CHAP domain-containing protein [Sphingomonas oryzagri]MDH7639516.1 CHAP domain-containing protein [Sphingomonas oryzagri]